MKTKKKLVAEDLSALLLPVSMRKRHRIHLHAQYKADFYVYILQNLSVALGQIILSLASCYIYDWLKRKKPTDFEITEVYLRKCHKEVVTYEKSVVTARRKYLAQSNRYPKSYEKELRAYEGALLTVKDPEQLTNSLAAAVKRRKRNNIKKGSNKRVQGNHHKMSGQLIRDAERMKGSVSLIDVFKPRLNRNGARLRQGSLLRLSFGEQVGGQA